MSHIECIVNVGFGRWHPKGTDRLVRSLIHHGFTGAIKAWKDELPPGSPTHEAVPYGLKVAALQWAFDNGHSSAMWLDSSVWCVRHPEQHGLLLARDGHYLLGNGDWRCDQWTNDACLAYFGLTREQAGSIPMISAGILGLDMRNERSREFFSQWRAAMEAGAFNGSWTARPEEGSGDRYRGHRHDQACASIIAHRLGMLIQPAEVYDMYYKPEMPGTVEFTLQGV